MLWMMPAAMMASSAMSGAMGMMSSNNANKASAANLNLQAALANQQTELASRQLNAQLAKQTDAQGNQTVYDPATNQWMTILSQSGRQLQEASDKEQLLRMTEDANMRRRGMQNNEARRQDEGRLADALLRQYQYTQSNPRDAGAEMTSALRLANAQGVKDANDELRRNYSVQGMRTGMGAAAMQEGLRQLEQNQAQSMARLNADAPIQGMQLGEAMANARLGDTLNQYNMLASRASNYDDVGFSPSSINQTLSAALANQRASAAQGYGQAMAANAGNAATLGQAMSPFTRPDMSSAQFAGGMANRGIDLMMMNQMGLFGGGGSGMQTGRLIGNVGSTP